MKVWHGFGSEHSANLVIIGTFRTEADAINAHELICGAVSAATEDLDKGEFTAGEPPRQETTKMKEFLKNAKPLVQYFNWEDTEDLIYDLTPEREANRVVVTGDDVTFKAYVKLLMSAGARVEIYSAHDHPGRYGR